MKMTIELLSIIHNIGIHNQLTTQIELLYGSGVIEISNSAMAEIPLEN